MKPVILYSSLVAAGLALAPLTFAVEEKKTVGEKTGEVIDKTVDKSKELGRKAVEKTREAGRAVAEGAQKATAAVKDAVTPDPTTPDADAYKVDVTLTEHKISMPKQLAPGKTAFVVHNAGKTAHNFEIDGAGLDEKFFASVDPAGTKTLHVNLKPGSYKVRCPMKGHEAKGMEWDLTVK